jgi:hypothetical protein
MALIDSKQLNPKFSGSFILSGSTQSLISNQVVIGSESGSATAHSNAALTILMGGTAGMMLPSASADPSGLGTSDKGMLYFDATDTLLKTFDGTSWIPVGDLNTKNTHLTMSADINNDGDGSTIIFRIDGETDSNIKFRLKSDNLHQVTGSLIVSGSITATSAPTSSTTITANNITNGYPTSNAWQASLEGSYFNNFDNTTHVSEILRFVAGVLSHSLDVADAAPNTKTYASIDTNENSLGGTDSINGYLPQSFGSLSNATLNYLNFKDLWKVGGTAFSGITTYYQNGPSHYIDFDSNSGGSSNVSSSGDTELFGLGGLTSGGATEFKARLIVTQSFSDTGSISAPTTASNTFTTQSSLDLSNSSFGTSDGLTIAKIVTSQPAVIPSAYQDGKFVDIGGTTMTGSLTRRYSGSNPSLVNDFGSVSASGYYRFHGLQVGIISGSQTVYTYQSGTTKNRFWAPISTIDSAAGTNALADVGTALRYLSATSRSLSGVPYLIDGTYEVSTKITGLFNPLYYASTTLVDMAASSVGTGTAGGSVSISGDTVSTSGGTIQTGTTIYDSTGATARSTGTVPYYNDIALVTGSVTFDSGNSDSIDQTGVADTTFTVATKARNRDNSQSTLDTQTISYHSAGTFGQPSASGSLAIYGRAQGYDGGALAGTTEQFSGESHRIKLADNVQEFDGTAWTTTYELNQLGTYELQVKPGYLVDPGGTYRYWYPASYHSSGTYKFYIRRFQTSGTKTGMTVDVGATLVNWNATTADSVAVAILFESSGNGSGNNASLGVARIYDPSDLTSNVIETDIAADNFKNPFSTAISLYGNSGGSKSSTEYTVPLRNIDGMYLDSNDNEFYVIVRYKGDPSPITSITTTTS